MSRAKPQGAKLQGRIAPKSPTKVVCRGARPTGFSFQRACPLWRRVPGGAAWPDPACWLSLACLVPDQAGPEKVVRLFSGSDRADKAAASKRGVATLEQAARSFRRPTPRGDQPLPAPK